MSSDETHNENLLVDQSEALDFYFDSMLLSDENDYSLDDIEKEHKAVEKKGSEKQELPEDVTQQNSPEDKEQIAPVDKLQSAKDFLQSSKIRQQNKSEQVLKSDYQSKLSQVTEEPLKTKLPVAETSKVITKGPVSPKPRDTELRATEIVSKKIASSSSIVFSNKNNNGEVSEQVLIPRSQRLASSKQIPQSSHGSQSAPEIISKKEPETVFESQSNSDKSTAETNNFATQAVSLEKEHAPKIEVTTNTQEAPNLDLSLFLPKIKTLSDTEITQQIEALTQAAVSQAKLESDLAHEAHMVHASQQVIKNTQAESDDGPKRNIDDAPSWAVPDFQVLLFVVAGLKMAVPLNELNGIVEWGDEYITELPGHKSWYLGIIQNQGKNVPVIDTLQQVVPKNRWPAGYLNEKKFKHIILIDNSRWGLACETVLEVVTLKTDSVKWRSSRTKRRWLLGTVIEHMCALLDSSEFAAMLKTGDDSLVS